MESEWGRAGESVAAIDRPFILLCGLVHALHGPPDHRNVDARSHRLFTRDAAVGMPSDLGFMCAQCMLRRMVSPPAGATAVFDKMRLLTFDVWRKTKANTSES
jgi:hypothetical protein